MIVVILLAVISVLTMSLGALNYFYERNLAIQRLMAELDISSEQLSSGLAVSVWNFDKRQIIRNLESIMRAPHIHSVALTTSEEDYKFGRDDNWNPIQTVILSKDDRCISKEVPVVFADRNVGTVTVFATPVFLEARLRIFLIQNIVVVVILDLTLVLSLYLMLKRFVIAPLRRLESYAVTVSAGSAGGEGLEDVRFMGELETLRSALGRMVALLDARYLALQASEERLQLATSAAGIGVWDWDVTQDRLSWDETMHSLYDIGKNKFEGNLAAWKRTWHLEDQEAMEGAIQDALQGEGAYAAEFRIVLPDASIHFIKAAFQTFRDEYGKPLRVVGICYDITEGKQAEASLRENEFLFRSQFDHGNIGVAITSVEKGWLLVNPKVLEIFGYSEAELRSKTWSEMTHPDDLEPDVAQFQLLLDDAIDSYEIEKRFFRKDGEIVYTHLSVACYRKPDRTVDFVIASLLDITAQKRADEERLELESQLRQAQKMEAVGQLAGGVAHDFNNLLQVILGYGELARDETQAHSPARMSVEEILEAGNKAKTLVSQLLAFSRQQVLKMEVLNLNDVINDLTKMIRRVIGEHITFDAFLGPKLGNVQADRGQIEQILINLCVNARDAMSAGGKITVETSNVMIDEAFAEVHSWAEPGPYALLSVTDTGSGMDKQTQDNVFEPFFTTKKLGEGTGLGLSTVYGLVTQHQGMVHVYSEVDQGTTFKIYLPLVEGSSNLESETVDAEVPGGTEIILLAEDDAGVRRLTKTVLERAGYTVLIATDGEEAVNVFQNSKGEIDLALLDVMMPKLGGRAVYERIRAMRPGIPVLFASGYSMNAIHTNFVLDEGLALIQKPSQRHDLLRRVREVLDNGDPAE
jgi:PAS domain S-box-containing protein